MKSTNKTKNAAVTSQINFKALFTGEVYATPVAFNPTAADLRRLKSIPEEWDINEPEYTRVIKDNDYGIVSLLLKFNPNDALKLKAKQYSDDVFVEYKIFVSNRPVVGNASGKTQLIDCHNQHGWVKLDGEGTLAQQVKAAQAEDSPYHPGDPMRKLNPDTCRTAKQGEVALYDLVFKMSTLDRHRINEDEPAKSTRLDEFKLGENPEKTFENIVNGDCTALNMLLASSTADFDARDYFVKEGVNNKVGIFLGVRPNQSNDKIYQDVLAPFTVAAVGFEAMFRPTDREWDYTAITHDGVALGKSKLSRDAVKHLTDEKYAWPAYWNSSFKFQEITIDDLPSGEVETEIVDAPKNDDLPF